MNSQVLAAPLQQSPSRKRIALIALLAAVAGAAAVFVLTGGGDSPQSRPHATKLRGPGFALAYPAGWKPVAADRLAAFGASPQAVVRRADGKGTVVVRRTETPRDQSLRALTRDVTRDLQRRFTDFRFVSARVTQLRGGKAFLYTFVRTRAKTAQSIALLKVGRTSLTVNGIAATGDPRAARDVAAIVRSFGAP
jgi:hypothetical protein